MKRYLLDTHILIWWLTDSPDLQAPVKMILQNRANEFYVSYESLREIVIKAKLKRADFQLNGITIADIANALRETLGVKLLPSKIVHLAKLEALIPIHNDPFDHILISQAIAERLILISHDGNFPFYESQGLKLLRA
ncbi:type II toxin-antitoxin system VapC family toxin [Spirosoma koreense]